MPHSGLGDCDGRDVPHIENPSQPMTAGTYSKALRVRTSSTGIPVVVEGGGG